MPNPVVRRLLFFACAVLPLGAVATTGRAQSDSLPSIVFIHGRGQDDGDSVQVRSAFVDAFKAGQRQWLGREIVPDSLYVFVWYADLIGKREPSTPPSPGCAFAEQPTEQLREDWRSALIGLASAIGLDGVLLRQFTRDTYDYLESGRRRCEVSARVLQALQRATTQGRETIVVAHSMGGIVSFAAIKQNAEQLDSLDRMRVVRFVTLGTQVGELIILRALFGQYVSTPYPMPRTIQEWLNLQNDGDKLAFPVGGSFATSDPRRMALDVKINSPGDRHAIATYLGDRTALRSVLQPWCRSVARAGRPPECSVVESQR